MEAYTIDEISGHTVMSKMRSLAKQCTEFMNDMNNSMSRMYDLSSLYTIDDKRIKIPMEYFKIGTYFISIGSTGTYVIDMNSLAEKSTICIAMGYHGTVYSYYYITPSGDDNYIYFTLMECPVTTSPISFEQSGFSLSGAKVKVMTSINEQESE